MKRNLIITLLLGFSISVFSQTYDINGDYKISGNVGIGTNTPSKKLEVIDNILINGSRDILIDANGGSMEFKTSVAGGWTMGLKYISQTNEFLGGWRAYGNSTALNYYYVGIDHTNPLLAIRPNGNIGIGTKTPSKKLEVIDDILINGSRDILIDANVGSLEFKTPVAGGWTMGLKYTSQTNEFLGGWRAYGNSTALNYYYVGIDHTNPLLAIKPDGNVGIGTISTGTHKLAVEGTIGAREIVVETGAWSDFVFKKNYKLKDLEEVENFIEVNNHLPDIPSEKEVIENGVALGEMDAKLLQKIEELTLYMIEMNKEVKALKNENELLKEEINTLKTQ